MAAIALRIAPDASRCSFAMPMPAGGAAAVVQARGGGCHSISEPDSDFGFRGLRSADCPVATRTAALALA